MAGPLRRGRGARAGRLEPLPQTTALGALIAHITGGHILDDAPEEPAKPRSFQPMNVNFGLFPPIEAPMHDAQGKRIKGKDKTVSRKQAMADRALADLASWLAVSAPDVVA